MSVISEMTTKAQPSVPTRRPIAIAHRGASRLAPENTLTAYAVALEIGMDCIEVDVRMAASGEVVYMHDD